MIVSSVAFPFEKVPSEIFGRLYRPIARASFWSSRLKEWWEVVGIVDSGADYTLLPLFYADQLGVNLKKDCSLKTARGVGGEERVFLCPKLRVSFLGERLMIPVGFLNQNNFPPLLGRYQFLDKFKVTFYRHQTYFECNENKSY